MKTRPGMTPSLDESADVLHCYSGQGNSYERPNGSEMYDVTRYLLTRAVASLTVPGRQ